MTLFKNGLLSQAGWREGLVGALLLLNIAVWASLHASEQSNLLHVYFLDVGQGDSIFIDSPIHGRVLLDGGPDRKVLTELGKILPFGDKRIDVVMESHPDADHITGLVDVVKQFDVSAFVEPGVESKNNVDNMLAGTLEDKNIPKLLARRGMNIDLGGGANLLVLFPNQDVSNWETNDASIVAKLTYRSKSFLLTGDSTKSSEYKILALGSKVLKSSVLKAGHHGSRNSTSLLYAEAVSPEYGVISAGKNNSYGHPHREVLDILNKVGAKIVSTTDMGTIEFETDGETLFLK
mgnify:CR=1 FL=1